MVTSTVSTCHFCSLENSALTLLNPNNSALQPTTSSFHLAHTPRSSPPRVYTHQPPYRCLQGSPSGKSTRSRKLPTERPVFLDASRRLPRPIGQNAEAFQYWTKQAKGADKNSITESMQGSFSCPHILLVAAYLSSPPQSALLTQPTYRSQNGSHFPSSAFLLSCEIKSTEKSSLWNDGQQMYGCG